MFLTAGLAVRIAYRRFFPQAQLIPLLSFRRIQSVGQYCFENTV